MAKITVHVVDESGNPVIGAPVGTGSISGYTQPSGWWGYESEYKEISVPTDKNGIAVIFIPKTESGVAYGVRNFPGYYDGGGNYQFKEVGAGSWQPWNPKVELVLKKIGIQMPMYARKVGGRMMGKKIPDTGKPVGFDLMVGDWVQPYGKGETPDFVFQFDSTITVTNSAVTYVDGKGSLIRNLYDNRLELRFGNQGDGIQFIFADVGSQLLLPRLAPTAGYQLALSKREWLQVVTNRTSPFVKVHSDYDKNANYFFRVRTKMDASGNITNALYGKIYGDFTENLGRGMIRFAYYLNPEPNSRNMEFNTKSNLFKNLPSLEQVSAP